MSREERLIFLVIRVSVMVNTWSIPNGYRNIHFLKVKIRNLSVLFHLISCSHDKDFAIHCQKSRHPSQYIIQLIGEDYVLISNIIMTFPQSGKLIHYVSQKILWCINFPSLHPHSPSNNKNLNYWDLEILVVRFLINPSIRKCSIEMTPYTASVMRRDAAMLKVRKPCSQRISSSSSSSKNRRQCGPSVRSGKIMSLISKSSIISHHTLYETRSWKLVLTIPRGFWCLGSVY